MTEQQKLIVIAARIQVELWMRKSIVVIDAHLLLTCADMVACAGWTYQQAIDHVISRGGLS